MAMCHYLDLIHIEPTYCSRPRRPSTSQQVTRLLSSSETHNLRKWYDQDVRLGAKYTGKSGIRNKKESLRLLSSSETHT